eukprot:204066_1
MTRLSNTLISKCEDNEFVVDHGCITCFENPTYSLMLILLFLSIILLSSMIMLFHAPMSYRTVSIWLWIQIASIVFYRASSDKQWGFLTTITIFSTSIWKSNCNNNNIVWEQGKIFCIIITEIFGLFFIFLCSTYIHHLIRHSLIFTKYKYSKLIINCLSTFEKRWQYQGNNNNNDNINNPDEIEIDESNDDNNNNNNNNNNNDENEIDESNIHTTIKHTQFDNDTITTNH